MHITHIWCHDNILIDLILMQMKDVKVCDTSILMTVHKYGQWKINIIWQSSILIVSRSSFPKSSLVCS